MNKFRNNLYQEMSGELQKYQNNTISLHFVIKHF